MAQRFFVLGGLFIVYEMRGALRIAHEATQEMLSLAQQHDETGYLVGACSCGGQTFWLLGDLASARMTFERGVTNCWVKSRRRESIQRRHSSEHGFTPFFAMGSILRGWALATEGNEAEGTKAKRKPASSRPWPLPGARWQSHWSCGLR